MQRCGFLGEASSPGHFCKRNRSRRTHIGNRISAGMGKDATYRKALDAINSKSVKPKVVVFDLDYTAWPFWCEMHSPADTPTLYPHVESIIEAIRDADVKFAVASRTPTPHVARAFLNKLDLVDKVDNLQLIPASNGFDHYSAQKDTAHFPNIRKELEHDYEEMLFFDDESVNINKVSKLGVCSILVGTASGVDLKTFLTGLDKFEAMNG